MPAGDVLGLRALLLLVAASLLGCVAPDAPAPPESLEQARARLPANPSQCKGLGKLAGAPAYPYGLLARRQSGWVIATFDVEGGRPQRSKVLASSPAGAFDAAVLTFLRTARFEHDVSARGCVEEIEFKAF